jgi:hypothetical protein
MSIPIQGLSGVGYQYDTLYIGLFFSSAQVCFKSFYVVLFSIVFVRLHKKEQSKDVVYSLLGFPLISMMVVIIPFIHCIYDALSGDESFVLYILQCFSGPAVGVYIFIAYCMDKDMKIRLAIMCDPDPVIVHKSDPDNEDNEMDSESNRTSNIPNNNEESVVDVSQEKKNVNGQ